MVDIITTNPYDSNNPVTPKQLVAKDTRFSSNYTKSASDLYAEKDPIVLPKYDFSERASYIQKVQGGSFMDLQDDEEFQGDLESFFKGSRYGLSDSEIKKLGPENLALKFAEHMRFQVTNEATAFMDLRYAKDTRNNSQEELASFGKLMSAWDSSETAGTGFMTGLGDYLESIVTSPSTGVSVAAIPFTLGTSAPATIMSKFLAMGPAAATALTLRQTISQLTSQGVAASVIKNSVPAAVTKAVLAGSVLEGSVGYGMVEAEDVTRNRVDDNYVEKTPQQKAITVGISASTGGLLSGFSSFFNTRSVNKAIETLFTQQGRIDARKTAGATSALNYLTQKVAGADGDKAPGQVARLNVVLDRLLDMTDKLEGKVNPQTQVKDRLDPTRVAEGQELRNTLLSEQPNGPLVSGLSMHTLQGIMAATFELTEKLEIGPNERITTAIADALQEGRLQTKEFTDIIDKFGLTREEFGNIFMSELSDAGTLLGKAGYISKLANRSENQEAEALLSNITILGKVGISTIDDIAARKAIDEAAEFDLGKSTLSYIRELDAARIGFMTSQLATTARNTAFSGARLGVDMVDQIFKSALTGTARAFGSDIPHSPARNTFSMLRGMTTNKDMSIVAKTMLDEDLPAVYKKLFQATSRVEVETGSDSLIARTTRLVNIANTATDHVFKQAAFYASVDRQLAELADPRLGNNFQEFATKGFTFMDLDNVLGEGRGTQLIDRAVRDSLDFVFQKGYEGSDTLFGQGANFVITANRKFPFTVSTVMPFPRYIANHTEFMFDYVPLLGGSKGIAEGFGKLVSKDGAAFAFSKDKGQVERWSKQMTGVMLFTGAYYARASQGGETEFTDFKFHENGNIAKAGPILGAANAHMLLADLYYRYKNDLPWPTNKKLGNDALEVIAGMGSLGFETGLIRSIRESYADGGPTAAFKNKMAELSTVFSYPATLHRDIIGQVDPERSYTAFKPDMMLEDNNMLVELQKWGEFKNRAMKNLPDFKWTQHAQSLNDASTLFRYSIFNERPIGTINPMMKQITGVDTRPQSDIQKELARLGLREFDVYKSTQIKNPVIRYAAEQRLSRSLGKTFASWRMIPQFDNESLTYNELDPSRQRGELEGFVKGQVAAVRTITQDTWNAYATNSPRAAAGYIRNRYAMEGKASLSGKYRFDATIEELVRLRKISPSFKTADQYLQSATSVVEQLRFRMTLMFEADKLQKLEEERRKKQPMLD